MLTTADFILIADSLAHTKPANDSSEIAQAQWRFTANHLISTMQAQRNNFDEERFRKAMQTEIEIETKMRQAISSRTLSNKQKET